MEIKYRLVFASLLITVTLLATIVFLGSFMNNQREQVLGHEFSQVTSDLDDMQTVMLLAESYGDDDFACLAFQDKLMELDSYIWDLGDKLDKYRVATEEFEKSPYYVEQKTVFNKQSLRYYLFMKNVVDKCDMNKQMILYFYQDSEKCSKCDDQSFILRDLGLIDEELNDKKELAIFSFDTELNVGSIDLLTKFYNLSNYPCVVINEEPFCGIQSKAEMLDIICSDNSSLNICSN